MCRPLSKKSFAVPSPLPAPPGKHNLPHCFWILFLTTSAIVGSAEWLAKALVSPAPSSAKIGRKAAPSDAAFLPSIRPRSTTTPLAPSSVMSFPPSYLDGAIIIKPSRAYEDKPRHSTVAAITELYSDDDFCDPPADAAPPASDESKPGDPATR